MPRATATSAHWQLGEKDRAREWFGKAVAWMDRHKPTDEELRNFRAEAAALLGLKDAPPAKGSPATILDAARSGPSPKRWN
jgi:hypothetical protein